VAADCRRGVRRKAAPTDFELLKHEGTSTVARKVSATSSPTPGVVISLRRGVTRALLFPKAILRAEFEADAPLRDAMRIKRERLRAKRAAKQGR
jgi:hypothetical protein